MSNQLELNIFNDPEAGIDGIQAPGYFIKKELANRGWSQADLSQILGRPLPTINEIIKGKRGILPEMAIALGDAFGQSADLWMHREAAYRLSLVKNAPDSDTARKAMVFDQAPVKEMQKRGWISPAARTAIELETEIEKFWVEDMKAVARKSSGLSEFSNAQLAWLCRSSALAERVNVRPFSVERLRDSLPKIRKLAGLPERAAHLPIYFAELGVRLVVVEALQRTLIDGAAFHLNNDPLSPVIALSLRIDRMESVWHTIGHEIFHILNGDPLSLDTDIAGKTTPKNLDFIEKRADDSSADWLVPQNEIQSFIRRARPQFTKPQLTQFANRIGIHPAIIVGQLHHLDELSWSQRNDLCPKIREHFLQTAMVDGHGIPPTN